MMHPEFQNRHDALCAAAEARGWSVSWYIPQERSYSEQLYLYNLYKAGKGNYAVPPGLVSGLKSPWGWYQTGSNHMVQPDGYSHAIDYKISGCTWAQFHNLANEYGIGFPQMGIKGQQDEPWHGTWWDSRGIYINHHADEPTAPIPTPLVPQLVEEEEDMAQYIQCNDGDIAAFITDGLHKKWVQNEIALEEQCRDGLVKFNGRDSEGRVRPFLTGRYAINDLITVGDLPKYRADYGGPYTTV